MPKATRDNGTTLWISADTLALIRQLRDRRRAADPNRPRVSQGQVVHDAVLDALEILRRMGH